MKTYVHTLAALAVVAAFAAPAWAQEQPAKPAPAVQQAQLRIQVVLSKYQGDKKVSNLPFTLFLASVSGGASLRMGAQVPIITAVTPDAKVVTGVSPVQQVSYRDVGTNIDCTGQGVDGDGRYRLIVSVDDSSVYTVEGQNAMRPGDHPSFRSFTSKNVLLLKAGQSAQFVTATDKVSGEVVKVDVTLTVVK